MSRNLKWALSIGAGLVAAAVVYAIWADVIWSIVAVLVGFSIGRTVAHAGSTEAGGKRSDSVLR
jgi:predicted permease